MKMDSTIINKEGIEKLLTMLPSEEEISRIEDAMEQTPDLPLGTAEQFLLTLRQDLSQFLYSSFSPLGRTFLNSYTVPTHT
jgi:hypothetical protein